MKPYRGISCNISYEVKNSFREVSGIKIESVVKELIDNYVDDGVVASSMPYHTKKGQLICFSNIDENILFIRTELWENV